MDLVRLFRVYSMSYAQVQPAVPAVGALAIEQGRVWAWWGRIRESWPHRGVGSGHTGVPAPVNLAHAVLGPIWAWESIAPVGLARRGT
jgi:hypothetical protein